MTSLITSILMTIAWQAPVAQTQPETPGAGSVTEQPDDDRRPARDDREDRRARWRARWEQYQNATPEQRRQLRLDRYVEMATETYELGETQKATVRAEIERMSLERRMAMGPKADEYDQLREKMFESWQRNQGDRPDGDRGPPDWRRMRDDPEFRAVRERIREIEREHPFDWQASMQRVEALLPEDQARKGRERMEQRWSRWRDRDGDRGDRRRERRGPNEGFDRRADRGDNERNPEALQGEILATRALLENAQREGLPAQVQDELRARLAVLEQQAAQSGHASEPQAEPHPWEKFVREFIQQHDLSASQQSAAMAILKDVLLRADRIERSNAGRFAEAHSIDDERTREKRLAELQKPIDQLFDEMKRRLDGLLSASQRKGLGEAAKS